MKKFISFILIIFICLFSVSCLIETPEQHFNAPKDGEPTGMYAIVSVSCETVLDNLDKVNPLLIEFIPEDGMIIKKQEVEIMRKDTALKLLTDTLKENNILYESGKNYLYSINLLSEKDFGAESGWLFFINGKFSSVGAASYYVQKNDIIEWRYSCVRGDVIDSGAAI